MTLGVQPKVQNSSIVLGKVLEFARLGFIPPNMRALLEAFSYSRFLLELVRVGRGSQELAQYFQFLPISAIVNLGKVQV